MKKIITAVFAFILVALLGVIVASASNGPDKNKGKDRDNHGRERSAQVSNRCDAPRLGIFSSSKWWRYWQERRNCPVDTIAPSIDKITVGNISGTSATISWSTNEKSTSEILFGTTANYSNSNWSRSLGTAHSITLKNLQPNTTYHYQITARDFSGNRTVSADATFTTGAAHADLSITNITVSKIGKEGVSITWQTNTAATTEVLYGTDTNYGKVYSRDLRTTNHAATLTGLSSGTTYHFQIRARDADGKIVTSSDNSFVAEIQDVRSPAISRLTITELSSNSAVLSFKASEVASAKIYYAEGTSVALPTAQIIESGTLSEDHRITISNLRANTAYFFIIEVKDASGNVSLSSQQTFKTQI
jgi:chitodextrinase